MKWDIENQKIVAKYLNRLAGVYEVAIKKAVGLGYSVTNYNSDKPFSFADYPVTNKKADTLFSQMAFEVQSIVNGGTESAWLAANTVNDGIVDKYFAKSGLSKEQLSKYYDRNLNALAAYQKRVDGGVKLSDRVWKYTNQFKNEIELAVSVGIGEGRSAAEVSRDVRQYLQQPYKLFHRVRNKYGELVLSKAAKAYHPGQGVYRSSYKNALRLTRTEINMSFHNADYERWNTLDFIAGYRVVLSKAHPEYDICDELQGEYPKTFAFWGWHVQCMCHTEPILSPQNEFVENLAKQLKGEDITGYVPGNKITQMPSNFKKWALDNQDRIAKAKSMPYFIDKNFKGTNVADWFKTAEKAAAIAEKTPLLSAKELEKLEWKKDEIIYAKKKLAEAEKWGVAGVNYDALVAAIENESLSYAQIAGKSSKLVQDIKAAKAAAADPFSEAALLKKFSKSEVDALFTAYDNFNTKKLSGLSITEKINKLEFEINWLKTNGKYSTSGVFGEILERDLVLLKKKLQLELENAELFEAVSMAKFKIEDITINDKSVKKAAKELEKELAKKNPELNDLKLKVKNLDNAVDDYYGRELQKNKIVFKPLDEIEIKRLLDDYEVNDFDNIDDALRRKTKNIWDKLTPEERNVVTKYTQTYSYLNEPLRGIAYYGELKPNAAHLYDMPILTSVLNKCRTAENMVVRRGVNSWTVKELGYGLDKLKPGDIFVDKGFSSTAIHRSGGFRESYDLVIVVPKGAAGIYAEPFSHFTDSNKFAYNAKPELANLWNGKSKESINHEKEWIGQRGSKYRVIKKEGYKIFLELIGQLH